MLRSTWLASPDNHQSTRLAPRSSLWLGNDHLLAIDSNGYSETYKRFHFQDIQALSLRLTSSRQIWNWALGVPTAICLGGWGYDLLLGPSIGLAGIIAGVACTLLFGLPLLINNLSGPTCACTLRTAVQTEELPSLLMLALALVGRGQRIPLRARLRAVSNDLVTLIFGVGLLLVWAGFVEAFLSQYHEPFIPCSAKIAFGLLELVLLFLFLAKSGTTQAPPR